MGYFRDDGVLSEMILDQKATKEFNTLWEEFEFIADYSTRTYCSSFYNETAEGGAPVQALRQRDVTTEATIFEIAGQLSSQGRASQ